MPHWSDEFLGIPFVPGGRDSSGFDCWGMVMHHRALQGITLTNQPELPGQHTKIARAFHDGITSGAWVEIEKPIDGCVVGMSRNVNFCHHCGLYVDLDGGYILHCDTPSVVRIPVKHLKIMGWPMVKYYKEATP